MLRFFPPVVTGTIILVIGITRMRIGINWAAGAAADTLPGYGDPVHLGVAAFVLIVILAITRFTTGFIQNVAVLLGIVAGAIVAIGGAVFAYFGVLHEYQRQRVDVFLGITQDPLGAGYHVLQSKIAIG